ncbi:hypothetical protein G6O67_003384 [Ophiocordyceps sinensis]|uniref:Uncharacterized protein n=1 Tax=Ophiocordyceps sinensis TaxID=72228 RepID=A0A8H4PWN9_9HYPO|nr:hypothetical protein G6O67_003384 [Ophiocordyceps sinensis]
MRPAGLCNNGRADISSVTWSVGKCESRRPLPSRPVSSRARMMGGDVIRSGVIRPLVQSSPLSPPSGYAAAAAAAAAAAIVPLVAAAKDKPPKTKGTSHR